MYISAVGQKILPSKYSAQREVLARSLGGIARVTIAETPAVSTPSDKKPRKAKAVSKAKGKRRAA
jgi:hypothetical protein